MLITAANLRFFRLVFLLLCFGSSSANFGNIFGSKPAAREVCCARPSEKLNGRGFPSRIFMAENKREKEKQHRPSTVNKLFVRIKLRSIFFELFHSFSCVSFSASILPTCDRLFFILPWTHTPLLMPLKMATKTTETTSTWEWLLKKRVC